MLTKDDCGREFVLASTGVCLCSIIDARGGMVHGRRIKVWIAGIGVRPRLAFLALIAIAPMFVLLIAGANKDRQLALDAATTRSIDLARLTAERQADVFQHAKDVLNVLRRIQQITQAPSLNCHSVLQKLAIDYPEFTSIGFVDIAGTVFCNNFTNKPLTFKDMGILHAAINAEPSAFVVGKFMIGPITGKPIVAAAVPLAADGKDDPPPGIAYVTLDLSWSAKHALPFARSVDTTWSVIDPRTGRILERSAADAQQAGTTTAPVALTLAMQANPSGGSAETMDIDGTPRLFGFAPLAEAGDSGIMVAVGLSRSSVLTAGNWRLTVGIAIAVLAALVAVGAAWLFGDRFQYRPIRQLVETARQVGAGNLAARVELAAWQAPEFRALAQTLGDMASNISAGQASLSESERQLRLLAENSTDMILRVRHDGQRLYASPACRTLLGFEPEEVLQILTQDAFHPDDYKYLSESGTLYRKEAVTFNYRARRKDGSYIWVEDASRMIESEPGQLPERIVVTRNIEQRIMAEDRLKESEALYRLLAEHGTDMVFQLDRNLVRWYVSPACREIVGYEPQDLIGKTPAGMIHPDDGDRVRQVFQSILDGRLERASIINRFRHRDGRWIWVEAVKAFRDSESTLPNGIIGALRDISLRKAVEDQLEEANRNLQALATQDGLTGLVNRRAFDDALLKEYRRALRDKTYLGLLMIDVDRFKLYNDRYGHLAGDECLRRVCAAIKSILRRPADLAARYGGEEFSVILPVTDEAGSAAIAERLRAAVLALAIAHEASPSKIVTVSLGVASLVPISDGKVETFVGLADRALYHAKKCGRNSIVRASSLGDTLGINQSSAA